MPSPLEFIQSMTQKLQPAKATGTEKSGSGTESADGAESAFSSALNQAIQQQAPTDTKSVGKSKDAKPVSEDFTNEPPVTEKDSSLNAAELADIQAQLITPELPLNTLPPEQQAGLLANLSQLAVQGTLQPEATTQPEPQVPMESLKTLPPTQPLTTPASSLTGKSEKSAQPSESEQQSDSIEMAQSFGLTTLSPEAMGLIGMPIEFQMQQVIQQAPVIPAETQAQASQAIESLNAQPTASSEASLAVQQAVNPQTPELPFEQALLDATQPIPTSPEVVTPTLEAAPDILKTEQPPTPAEVTLTSSDEPSYHSFAEALPEVQMDAAPKAQSQPSTSTSALPEDSENSFASLLQPVAQTTNAQATSAPVNPNTTPQDSMATLASLQEKLSALNGEIESLPAKEETDAFQLSEGETIATEASDALPPLVSFDVPTGVTSNTPMATADKLPQILSNAVDPADQVVDGTIYGVKNGHKELILKLNPDNLGEVRINLISHGNNEMSARLIASNPESHALLKNQAESLKASLEAQGIQIDRLSVVLAGQTESSSNTNQHDQPQQFEQNRHQSASSNQQQSFQQPEQNPNLFFQNGGQFQPKQGFAQNPGASRYNQSGGTGLPEAPTSAESVSRRNDNGNLSLLA